MRVKRFLVISVLVVLILYLGTQIVSALSFTVAMVPSNTTIPASTEFTIKIKVSNIDAGANGINSLSGYFNYDKTIFETISSSSIEGLNGWTMQSYNAENGKITLTKISFVKAEEDVFQVTLKTKSDADGKSGEVSYKTIVASNSEVDIKSSDIATTIGVGTAPTNVMNIITNNTNTVNTVNTINVINTINTINTVNTVNNANTTNNTNIANTLNTVNAVNTSNKTNSTNTNIPYTGENDNIFKLLVGVLIIALISFYRYNKVKDIR